MSMLKHTIVYAEDDLDDLFIMTQAFQKHDHIEVVHAPDGKKAMVMLEGMAGENSLPCLVILDINMPVMNGREALQAIRSHNDLSKLPVVLFSTSSSASDRLFAEAHEAYLITKPSDFLNLETIVTQFLGHCNFEINNISYSGS
ncbi:response regulator [Flavisolibacter sp. BT320]|nr:response regulator [Flavisolibacter longurius]